MLEINTIRDFQALPLDLQGEVQKAIKAKERLETYLESLNKKNGSRSPTVPYWTDCWRCKPYWAEAQEKGKVLSKPEEEEERDNSDIHPSQINKCLKALFYACAGYSSYAEEHVDPRLRMIFDLGTAWHDTMQRYGKRGAWGESSHYQKEAPIDPDARNPDGTPTLPLADRYWIKGHADALVTRYYIPHVPRIGEVSLRMVHEYKTINSGGYSKLISPKPEHKFQATIYSAVFDVPIVVYLYTNKDTSMIADFPVPFDYSIWNEIAQKIDRVQYYVNGNFLPPWEETSAVKNPAECRECGFRKICEPPISQIGRRTT